MVLCSYPVLSHRHMAGPAERRHDCHHFRSGLPTFLPARGLCWSHCPQLCVSTASLEGWSLETEQHPPQERFSTGSFETGQGVEARGCLPWSGRKQTEPWDFKVRPFTRVEGRAQVHPRLWTVGPFIPQLLDWECSSVEHLPRIWEALGSIPTSPTKDRLQL